MLVCCITYIFWYPVHLVISFEAGAVYQETIVPEASGGVYGIAQALLGSTLVVRGDFCATVGAVDEETIKHYIESQRWEDDGGEGFKVEPPPSP